MKNTVEDESENQPDEIPRDTQLKNQYIESPSANDTQQNQINQMTPSYPWATTMTPQQPPSACNPMRQAAT